MTEYRLTPKAVDDLIKIWSYIADDNIDAANRVEAAVYEACTFLAGSPLAGRIRKDLTMRTVRFWSVQSYPNYLIVYNPDKTHSQNTPIAVNCCSADLPKPRLRRLWHLENLLASRVTRRGRR